MEALLTPEEVATRLRISRRTVVGWLQEGRIPGVKVGNRWRIRETQVDLLVRVPSAEDRDWLDSDLAPPLPPYDWGAGGEPEGRPVVYRPGQGLLILGVDGSD